MIRRPVGRAVTPDGCYFLNLMQTRLSIDMPDHNEEEAIESAVSEVGSDVFARSLAFGLIVHDDASKFRKAKRQ